MSSTKIAILSSFEDVLKAQKSIEQFFMIGEPGQRTRIILEKKKVEDFPSTQFTMPTAASTPSGASIAATLPAINSLL